MILGCFSQKVVYLCEKIKVSLRLLVIVFCIVGIGNDAISQSKLFLRNGMLLDVESTQFDSIYCHYQRKGITKTLKNKEVFAISSTQGTRYLIGRKARRDRNSAPLFYPSNKRFSLESGVTLTFEIAGINYGINYALDNNYEYEVGLSVMSGLGNYNEESIYYKADFRKFVSLLRRSRFYVGISAITPQTVIYVNLGHRTFILPNVSFRNAVGFGWDQYGYNFLLEAALDYNFNIGRIKSTTKIK